MGWKKLVLVALAGVSSPQVGCIQGREAPPVTDMVQITSGLTFTFGRSEPCESEYVLPGQKSSCSVESYLYPVTEPEILLTLEPFALDVHEVTNGQYELCVQMGDCSEPVYHNAQAVEQEAYYGEDLWLGHPVVQVTWQQAKTYCESVDKRLPTQFEWERVARGNPDEGIDRRWPSDFMPDDEDASGCSSLDIPTSYCRTGDIKLVAVDDFGDDVVAENGKKIRHLFGNVTEWMGDPWQQNQLLTCKSELPDGCYWCLGCKEEDLPCQSNCKICAACGVGGGAGDNPPTDLTCHVGCEGESRYHPVSVVWEAGTPLKPADLDLTGDLRAVRGGSVLTGAEATCRSRTDNRSTGRDPNQEQPQIGFRCAKSL